MVRQNKKDKKYLENMIHDLIKVKKVVRRLVLNGLHLEIYRIA